MVSDEAFDAIGEWPCFSTRRFSYLSLELLKRIDGKPYHRILPPLKTTIEIPDAIYRRAKILAIERDQTLKDFVLNALERELKSSNSTSRHAQLFGERRQWVPAYKEAQRAGEFRVSPGSGDATDWISQDRDDR